jgi:hypothetical protein
MIIKCRCNDQMYIFKNSVILVKRSVTINSQFPTGNCGASTALTSQCIKSARGYYDVKFNKYRCWLTLSDMNFIPDFMKSVNWFRTF